jgi:dipeptidyl aminopeptidase/acylaminoacyl peptidase
MTPEDIFQLRWLADAQISADGKQIAFSVTALDRDADDYRAAIWTAPADGAGPPRQLTSGAARDGEPRWSPDGRWLAFTSSREGGKAQLYLLPAAGGEAVRLTEIDLGVAAPVWSPDSRRICVVGKLSLLPKPDPNSKLAPPARVIGRLTYKLNGEGFTYDKHRHLFVVDVPPPGETAAEPRQLTDGDWDDTAPAWSPDGRSIAFVSARHDERDYDHVSDIYCVDVESGATERVTDGTFALDSRPGVRTAARLPSSATASRATNHGTIACGSSRPTARRAASAKATTASLPVRRAGRVTAQRSTRWCRTAARFQLCASPRTAALSASSRLPAEQRRASRSARTA